MEKTFLWRALFAKPGGCDVVDFLGVPAETLEDSHPIAIERAREGMEEGWRCDALQFCGVISSEQIDRLWAGDDGVIDEVIQTRIRDDLRGVRA